MDAVAQHIKIRSHHGRPRAARADTRIEHESRKRFGGIGAFVVLLVCSGITVTKLMSRQERC